MEDFSPNPSCGSCTGCASKDHPGHAVCKGCMREDGFNNMGTHYRVTGQGI